MGPTLGYFAEEREVCTKLRPTARLADLVADDFRWGWLLKDSEGLFGGNEAIDAQYQQYLLDMLCIMEEYECTFQEAVKLSATCVEAGAPQHLPTRAGVADYLLAKRSGLPLGQALVYNLKASSVGPDRAELCTWRRKEAQDALTKGRLTIAAAESCLAKGSACTERELAEVDESLQEAKTFCFGLGSAIEILEANSGACGEGSEVMAEYEEMLRDASACNARLCELCATLEKLRRQASSRLRLRGSLPEPGWCFACMWPLYTQSVLGRKVA